MRPPRNVPGRFPTDTIRAKTCATDGPIKKCVASALLTAARTQLLWPRLRSPRRTSSYPVSTTRLEPTLLMLPCGSVIAQELLQQAACRLTD